MDDLERLRNERNAFEHAQARDLQWTDNKEKELEKLKMQLQFKEESVQTLKSANEQYRDKTQALEDEVQA